MRVAGITDRQDDSSISVQYLWIVTIIAYQQDRHGRTSNMTVKLKMSLYLAIILSTEFLNIKITLVYGEITRESGITRSCGKKH
jgi:hypothetical protein